MPTKISLALGPRQPLSRQTAWGCFTTNLAMPGFGSLMAGRFSGYPQAALALAGMLMTVGFGFRFLYWYLNHRPGSAGAEPDPVAALVDIWMAVRWALFGFFLFLAGWLWALATSSLILRAAKAAEAAQVPPRLG
jgi:hypothetical protein